MNLVLQEEYNGTLLRFLIQANGAAKCMWFPKIPIIGIVFGSLLRTLIGVTTKMKQHLEVGISREKDEPEIWLVVCRLGLGVESWWYGH